MPLRGVSREPTSCEFEDGHRHKSCGFLIPLHHWCAVMHERRPNHEMQELLLLRFQVPVAAVL